MEEIDNTADTGLYVDRVYGEMEEFDNITDTETLCRPCTWRMEEFDNITDTGLYVDRVLEEWRSSTIQLILVSM